MNPLREEVTRAITCAVQARPGLSIDDLVLACTPYTWNQVFLALDDLVRNGVVTLKQGGGFYMVSVALAYRSGYEDRKTVAHSSPS